jgi:hypothetical protein
MTTTTLAKLEDLLKDLHNKVDELRRNKGPEENDVLNVIAAKIIKDIGDKIDACECTKELVAELRKTPKKEPETTSRGSSFQRYSYPNFQVGNAGLGSSGNPNALTRPYGVSKKEP